MRCAIFTSTVDQNFFSSIQQKYIDYSKKCKADLIIRQTQHSQNYNIHLKATFERYDLVHFVHFAGCWNKKVFIKKFLLKHPCE